LIKSSRGGFYTNDNSVNIALVIDSRVINICLTNKLLCKNSKNNELEPQTEARCRYFHSYI